MLKEFSRRKVITSRVKKSSLGYYNFATIYTMKEKFITDTLIITIMTIIIIIIIIIIITFIYTAQIQLYSF